MALQAPLLQASTADADNPADAQTVTVEPLQQLCAG